MKFSWNVNVQRRCCHTSRRYWVTQRTMKLRQKSRQRCSRCATSSHASTRHRNPLAKMDDSSCSFASVLGIKCSFYIIKYFVFDFYRISLRGKYSLGLKWMLLILWVSRSPATKLAAVITNMLRCMSRSDRELECVSEVTSASCHVWVCMICLLCFTKVGAHCSVR